jgi:hypothetical protein
MPAVLTFGFSDSCTALKKQRFSNPPRVKDEGLWYNLALFPNRFRLSCWN